MTDFPNRPDHPDFWLMAEVVQDLDAAADDGMSADRIVSDLDMASVAYMASQRGLRAYQLPIDGWTTKLSAAWLEAFVMGVMYQRRKDQKS